jgi:pimeloyl-ACP methyl ester carboxylesterase
MTLESGLAADPKTASISPEIELLGDITLHHRFAELGSVRLHYVEAGTGPLVLLIHGFPEFWYTWRGLIPPLVAAGFRVVALDLRGYNLSSKPSGVAAYGIRTLTEDVHGLIRALGATRAHVVGHDWGAGIAWAFAMRFPEALERLAVLNGPHPVRLLAGLRKPRQLIKSWYMFWFQLPYLPERLAERHDYAFLTRPLERNLVPYDQAALARYREAFAQPGAVHAMINYYRAALRPGLQFPIKPIDAPTLIVWGERDAFLGRELAQPDSALVPNARVAYLPDAGHFVHHDAPAQVAELLVQFMNGATSSTT